MFPKGGMGGMYKKAQQMQKEMARNCHLVFSLKKINRIKHFN